MPVPPLDPVVVGQRLRLAREKKNIALADLARRADLAPERYAQFEAGAQTPTLAEFNALARLLGFADYLLGVTDHVPTLLLPDEDLEFLKEIKTLKVAIGGAGMVRIVRFIICGIEEGWIDGAKYEQAEQRRQRVRSRPGQVS